MNQTAIEIKNQRQYTIEAMYSTSIMFEYEIHTFFELKYFSESQNKFCISTQKIKQYQKCNPRKKLINSFQFRRFLGAIFFC